MPVLSETKNTDLDIIPLSHGFSDNVMNTDQEYPEFLFPFSIIKQNNIVWVSLLTHNNN